MKQDFKISIIVPVYNVQEYISQCLESLIHQTYHNTEIILINDGSKDNTSSILQDYSIKDNRIIVINQENQGVSASRNEGLKRASGDYIMFCDSDDWYELNACEIALKTIIENNADIVMFGYVREYKGNSLPKAMFNENQLFFEGQEVRDRLHRRIFGPIR